MASNRATAGWVSILLISTALLLSFASGQDAVDRVVERLQQSFGSEVRRVQATEILVVPAVEGGQSTPYAAVLKFHDGDATCYLLLGEGDKALSCVP